jgi:hypothetical protein
MNILSLFICVVIFIIILILICVNAMLYQLLRKTTNQLNAKSHECFVWSKWNYMKAKDIGFLENALLVKGYKKIAIYGCGYLGKYLYSELKGTSISAEYYIDRNAGALREEIPVVLPNSREMLQVDVIVVTVVAQYYEIKNNLKNISNADVISIEDVL